MSLAFEDICEVIKHQIKNYSSTISQDERGHVIQIGDGIAKVHGVEKCKANELLLFENGSYGMAINLEESYISVVMLGTDVGISEGGLVKCTGQVVSVPVGEGEINFDTCFRLLSEAGYAGPLTLEYECQFGNPRYGILQSLAHMRRCAAGF